MADVGLNTVNRFECGKNSRESSIAKIIAALEKAGVEFNADGLGVRLKPKKTTRKPK
jgi:hypothetical protein